MDRTQVGGGLALVVFSTLLIFATGVEGSGIPLLAASLGALGLSVGTLLVGTSKSRQV